MKRNRGFTLIELVIVITIISVLASIAMINFLKYRYKSIVTSKALPYAEKCAGDTIDYCLNLKPSSPVNVDIASIPSSDCQPRYISSFDINLRISGNIVCESTGYISSGTVNAAIDEISDYTARCFISSEGIKCRIYP